VQPNENNARNRWLLEARGVTKQFPGVRALRGVQLRLRAGEVLAVIGENGAGKSTLMKILAGVQHADAGEIWIEGQRVALGSVQAALRLGIALIHQELNLAENLDISANIFLGREPTRHGLLDEARMRREAARVLARVGLQAAPETRVGQLSIGQRQLVEIAKALAVEARVLIMDEPTSSLSRSESEHLFQVIRDMRGRGMGVVYISHRLGEVRTVADRVLVLRDGENAGELEGAQIAHDPMVRLMVGRDVSQFYRRTTAAPPARTTNAPETPALQVNGLRTRAYPRHALHLTVAHGEVVGIAGLVGAGRTELLRAIFGIDPRCEGEVLVAGKRLHAAGTEPAIHAGLALVPEDRKQEGLILTMAVRENLSLAGLHLHQRHGLLDRRREQSLAATMIARLGIKTPHDRQPVQFLSGGNQQKVVFGKWLGLEPRVLLLDEPTRGIDVGAKAEIYAVIEQLAARGAGVLFVSSEMEEILGLSDRVLVMHQGDITGALRRPELSEEAVMRLATLSAGPRPAAEASE
jgi:ribose transport system ATP-binding protein